MTQEQREAIEAVNKLQRILNKMYLILPIDLDQTLIEIRNYIIGTKPKSKKATGV